MRHANEELCMYKTVLDALLQMSPFLKSHMIQIEHGEVIPKHAFCLTGRKKVRPCRGKEKRDLRETSPLWWGRWD
jgi:hypothetical protein